jgi:hypothetical protein
VDGCNGNGPIDSTDKNVDRLDIKKNGTSHAQRGGVVDMADYGLD